MKIELHREIEKPSEELISLPPERPYVKQCGCSNANLDLMLKMMSTLTSMLGFACFISNFINAIQSHSFLNVSDSSHSSTTSSESDSSTRPGILTLSFCGFSKVILGLLELHFQKQKNHLRYLLTYTITLPVAILSIYTCFTFFNLTYYDNLTPPSPDQCQSRVSAILNLPDQSQLFTYYSAVKDSFCSDECPCNIVDSTEDTTKQFPNKIQLHDTWESCSPSLSSGIQRDEQLDAILVWLENNYDCAGICELHERYAFKTNYKNQLPKQTCFIALTEEMSLLSKPTTTLTVVTSSISLFFFVLFALINRKVAYIWDYQTQKTRDLFEFNQRLKQSVNQVISELRQGTFVAAAEQIDNPISFLDQVYESTKKSLSYENGTDMEDVHSHFRKISYLKKIIEEQQTRLLFSSNPNYKIIRRDLEQLLDDIHNALNPNEASSQDISTQIFIQ